MCLYINSRFGKSSLTHSLNLGNLLRRTSPNRWAQLHQIDPNNGVYLFTTADSNTIKYDLTNMTYVYTYTTESGNATSELGTILDEPLSFPQLGLAASATQWKKNDFPPAVVLRDVKMNRIVVNTAGSRYGYIAELKICAITDYPGTLVPVGLISIQLQYLNFNGKCPAS